MLYNDRASVRKFAIVNRANCFVFFFVCVIFVDVFIDNLYWVIVAALKPYSQTNPLSLMCETITAAHSSSGYDIENTVLSS